MSSKKRSKSRSRSNSKSAKPNAYGPAEDEVKKGGFFAMLIGMTLSLMLVFFIISLFNPQAKKGDAAAAPSGIDDSVLLLNSNSFDQFLKEANPDQILAKINTLKASNSQRLSPARVSENKDRIELSKRLLKLDAAPSYKKYAKLEWMQAQKSNYGIDFIGGMNSPHVADEFEKCYTRFLNDTDQDVYEEAHLSRVSHVLFECLKGNRKPEEVAKYLNEVLEEFPDAERVSATIRLQFKVAIESDIDLAKQLAEEVLRGDSLKNDRAADLMHYVLDTYQIVNLNYDEMFINRFANGEVGLRELEKTSLQLLNNPEGGVLIVKKVQEVARWFEGRRMFDTADRIYVGMEQAASLDRQVAETKDLLMKIGKAGHKRMSLVGQKVPISGTTMTGKQLSDDNFKNRIVLIVFFNPSEKNSLSLVNRVARSAERYAEYGSPVRVIGVPSDASPFEDKLIKKFNESRIQFLKWMDGQPPSLLSIYPVIENPHLMVLDHEGRLARVELSPQDYNLDIEALMDQR